MPQYKLIVANLRLETFFNDAALASKRIALKQFLEHSCIAFNRLSIDRSEEKRSGLTDDDHHRDDLYTWAGFLLDNQTSQISVSDNKGPAGTTIFLIQSLNFTTNQMQLIKRMQHAPSYPNGLQSVIAFEPEDP